MRVISFLLGLGLTLLDTADSFFEFLTYSYTIGGETYAVYELMFGGGLVFALTYILVSWIADLLP